MEPRRQSVVTRADVELCAPADPGVRALVRAVAGEAATPGRAPIDEVREATDTLVCAVLPLAREGSRLRCRLSLLDSEVRIHVSLLGATVGGPAAKAHSSRVLERLDGHVSMSTVSSHTYGSELVCETVVPSRAHDR